MLRHKKATPNDERIGLLQESDERYQTDGLRDLSYQVVQNETRPLYTWLLVDF